LIRSFCRAGKDSVVTVRLPSASIVLRLKCKVRRIEVPCPQHQWFCADTDKVLAACTTCAHPAIHPGTQSNTVDVAVCRQLNGRALVVVDEAYIESPVARV
jgi:histidinol-phosphate/aromatic aminotransferase/cobyric acid decarboxylase-like protein